MTLDRRKFVRLSIDVSANIFLFQTNLQEITSLIDISQGGCFFPIKHKVPIGEKCDLQLTFGEGLNNKSIDITGIVVRQNQQGVGIQFTDMSISKSTILKHLLVSASQS